MLGLPGIFVQVCPSPNSLCTLKTSQISSSFPSQMIFFSLPPRKWKQSPPHSPVSLHWILTIHLPEIRPTLCSLLWSSRLPLTTQGHCSCNHCFSLILWVHCSLLDYTHHRTARQNRSHLKLRKEKRIFMRAMWRLAVFTSLPSFDGSSQRIVYSLSQFLSCLPPHQAFSLISQDYPYSA